LRRLMHCVIIQRHAGLSVTLRNVIDGMEMDLIFLFNRSLIWFTGLSSGKYFGSWVLTYFPDWYIDVHGNDMLHSWSGWHFGSIDESCWKLRTVCCWLKIRLTSVPHSYTDVHTTQGITHAISQELP
jgi:hypothetical protein